VKNVLLVKMESVGSETEPRGLHPPFSILYLADVLEKAGFRPQLFHEEGTQANIDVLLELVRKDQPLFVGFSVLTGPQIIPSLKASLAVKEKSHLPVLWGGLQPTLLPELVLGYKFIDVIALSEGERTIVDFAQALADRGLNPDVLAGIDGICFKDNGQIVFTRPRPFIKNLDDIHAAWHLLDIERYIRPEIYLESYLGGKRAMAINTSRGCPWRCGYCYNPEFNKRTFRAQSAPRVIEEVQLLKDRYNITGLRFSEDHFFSNHDRALKIIKNIDIPWSATIRVNDLANGGEDFVRELAENRCAILRCGVESGSQQILDRICKDITLEQVREAARRCAKYGITIGFFFMLGFPGETWADILKTLDIMDELDGMGDSIIIALPSIYCPYPGTPLLDSAIRSGFQPPTSLEGWGTTIDKIVKSSGRLPPYVDKKVERVINYLRLSSLRDFDNVFIALSAKFFRNIATWRWRHRFFAFPIDWHFASLGRSRLKEKVSLEGR
jgi:anaerobic magnesium-protoporphyrin IX monomethyl ester cyclase